jgi:pyruvate,water dikinase
MSDIRTFDQIGSADGDAVGGKGLSLGLMAGAGLPVPPGFCVTSAAYRRLKGQTLRADPDLSRQVATTYQALGGGPVAVRSSATAEDGAVTSFAGQQETILGVSGNDAVLEAITRCWASLDSERAVAYRQRQGVDDANLAMAVVVQRLINAEIAGVLFTRDPLDSSGRRMLVEASWGLGASVVSGRVTPDRYHLDRETGAVLERHVNTKPTLLTATGPQAVPIERQNVPCLDETQLARLAALGQRVEAFYGDARDVEWAWAEGRFWLLQARPITTAGAAEREQVRREEIAALAARAQPGGTVWSRYNLAEILPEPTPMTWAIVRRFMSGKGGFGLMYHDLGFDPDPALDEEGIFDLVCGRPYCNLSREPRMQSRSLPFEHPFAVLKADPQKASYPQAILNPARGGWRFWMVLPVLFQSFRSALRVQRLSETFAQQLREAILPAFAAEADREAGQELTALAVPELLERLEFWIRRTLVDFARDSLKPTALAAVAMAKLKSGLVRTLGPDRTVAALGELTMGVHPDPEADLPAAIRDLGEGRLEAAAFLKGFGHRGSQEMELAQPRWAEDPGAPSRLVAQGVRGELPASGDSKALWDRIAEEAKLPAAKRTLLEPDFRALQTYLGLRETAKHYLMKGYALIRRILVELDRRFKLGGGIFFLTPEELPALAASQDMTSLIALRRRRRSLALSLEVPQVLFSDDLEAIGRPAVVTGADTLQGIPLSAGVVEGPALVLHEPEVEAATGQAYILVCPSTDPAWVPLFVHARGVVMETGGVLSHGAIVAREFGLPAVAGLPDIHRRLRSGQRLHIDGGTGRVTILPSGPCSSDVAQAGRLAKFPSLS